MLRKLRLILLVPAALGFAFIILSGQTSSPTSAPSAAASHVQLAIPANPPPGADPGEWAAMRQICQVIADKFAAHIPLKPNERADIATCFAMTPQPLPPEPSSLPSAIPAPEPLPVPDDSSSSLAPTSDPPVGPIGSPIPAGGANACTVPQNTTAQPPDVAADVGGATGARELVELLNFGIWVINEPGGSLRAQQDLYTFWSANGPSPNTDQLTDTQIAFEPISQRWLASTEDVTEGGQNGSLYFAFSQTQDASPSAGWNVYSLSNICSGPEPNDPVPDQPIIGYNQSWVAIDVQCGVPGVGFGNDQIVLIPHSVLTVSPAPSPGALPTTIPSPAPVPFFGARPSRDILGTANKNLYIVGSVAPPSPSTTLPYVQVSAIDSTGAYAPPGSGGTIVNSPGNGVLGFLGLSSIPAPHDSCGTGSGCNINLEDDRITNVILQTKDSSHHYLATSFHAGDRTNNTVQALWFIGNVDTFSQRTPQWNNKFLDAAGKWFGYPTITIDPDLDVAFTETTFALGSQIQPSWFMSKGFSTTNGAWAPLLGNGTLTAATSTGSYSGQLSCSTATPSATPTPQRWGDYTSTVWDPNLKLGEESGGFWTVQEFSTGNSNQSTDFVALQDPLPYFVGSSTPINGAGTQSGEAECGTAGNLCKLIYSAPSGAQFGDVFLADVLVGENGSISHLSLPAGWTALPLKNQGNSQALISGCSGCGHVTSFLLMYVYGSQSGDTGQYTIGYTVQTGNSEMAGFLVSYRGANSVASNYFAYGYPGTGFTTSFSTGSLSPAVGTTLLNLFTSIPVDNDSPEGGETQTFNTLSGSPALTAETPLTVGPGWDLAADVAVSISQTYGPYTVTTGNALNYAHQVVIPEP